MDVYSMVMYCLSSLGFFIIFFSMYLLITVPTKLTTFSRFVIHGHDVAITCSHLYITIGLQPSIILPCASGYTGGILTRFGIMSTINQAWIFIALITTCSASSLLLVMHRVLAVSLNLSDRCKNIILIIYFSHSFAQLLCVVFAGFIFEDGGLEARDACMKKVNDYPKEMDTLGGLNFIFSFNKEVICVALYTAYCTVFYSTANTVCGIILVLSIRRQASSSQSAQFVANQRRITAGIIYFSIVELVAVGVPVSVLTACCCLSMGNVVVSHYALISIALYPVFAPYYVLMSNTEYRRRVVDLTTRGRKVTILQPNSINS